MIDLETLHTDARQLEALPQSAGRLASLLTTDDWDVDAVCGVVRLDEALTGRLLGVANSSRSGAREEITTVEAAFMRLGTGTVLGLALGAAVRRDFQVALTPYGLEEGALWRHSVAAALAAEEALQCAQRRIPPEAFATALLHDVGKLVLSRHLTGDVIHALCTAQGEAAFDARTEELILGIEHGELGGEIARGWGLPARIVEGIEFHERPLAAPSDVGRLLATVVGMADAAAVRAGAPSGGPQQAPEFTPEQAGALGISNEAFARLCDRVAARMDGVLERYA
jgi:HD-like signal output (HDOD) protein